MTPERAARGARPSLEHGLFAKTLAGVAGGFGLALAVSALLMRYAPGGLSAPSKFHVAMWLVPPVWIAVAGSSVLFRSGARAVLCLAAANLAAYAALWLAPHALS